MNVSRVVRQVRPVHAVVGGVSPAEFVREYQLPARPALFKQLVVAQAHDARPPNTVHWPALHSWSQLENGHETLGGLSTEDSTNVIVPVEVSAAGHGYTSAAQGQDWQRIEMPFGKSAPAPTRHTATDG